MKVLVAPNAFKGTLTAPQAAAAIGAGIRDVFPDAEVIEIPVADGGDGTVEALVSARRGEYRSATVKGPLGEPVDARYGLIDAGATAVVELATASGLALIPASARDPKRASTYGFGQLLDAARRAGVREIIAGIGGSATNDGGAGMAQALGVHLLDAAGRELPHGGAALINLDHVDTSRLDPGWRSVRVRVACDVTNPLTGPTGASHVYGPQKGADAGTVEELDRALRRFGEVVGVDELPGAGAAGGTGAGLVAFLGATLEPGAPLVVGATGFDAELAGTDLVFTGEGRADEQTAYGKAPGEVARRAAAAGVPVVLLAGSKGPGWEALQALGVTEVVTLTTAGQDPDAAFRDPGGLLRRAAVVACRSRRWER